MALQIVTEKPQPPLWEQVGFDDNLPAAVYRNRLTDERVCWSMPLVIENSKDPRAPKTRKPDGYISPGGLTDKILEAVCDGLQRQNQIIARLNRKINPGGFLDELVDCGYVKRSIGAHDKYPRYTPTPKGIEENKRLSKIRAILEMRLTHNQERALIAIEAGVNTVGAIKDRACITERAAYHVMPLLVERGLVRAERINATLKKYYVTDAGRVIAKALR